ncbi:hypothetical protein [Sporosarcina sp. HYO08]|uniref:hypothetical protein n=1 Tax=Sporosarcina sp. HYO08 TaxID=1759557 RepID=UPI0012E38ABC|nr:hypothetical protein [Sporosarcina sp. HYO08]
MYDDEFGQDEQFFFIAGYTEGGAPYGISWEEAYAEGLVEEENTQNEERGKRDESLPF